MPAASTPRRALVAALGLTSLLLFLACTALLQQRFNDILLRRMLAQSRTPIVNVTPHAYQPSFQADVERARIYLWTQLEAARRLQPVFPEARIPGCGNESGRQAYVQALESAVRAHRRLRRVVTQSHLTKASEPSAVRPRALDDEDVYLPP